MSKILNIGCGNESYGTDRIDFIKTDTTTMVHDIEKGLPYESEIFDEVYSKSVLEHIRNLKNLIDEIYRVMKVGGKFWVRTDYAGYLPMYIFSSHEHNAMLKISYDTEGDNHYHLFVESHLIKLFNKFKNLEVSYFYGGRNKFYNFLLRLLPYKLGAFHIEIKGEK